MKIDVEKSSLFVKSIYEALGLVPTFYVTGWDYEKVFGVGNLFTHTVILPNKVANYYVKRDLDIGDGGNGYFHIRIPLKYLCTEEKKPNELTENIRRQAKELETLADELEKWADDPKP